MTLRFLHIIRLSNNIFAVYIRCNRNKMGPIRNCWISFTHTLAYAAFGDEAQKRGEAPWRQQDRKQFEYEFFLLSFYFIFDSTRGVRKLLVIANIYQNKISCWNGWYIVDIDFAQQIVSTLNEFIRYIFSLLISFHFFFTTCNFLYLFNNIEIFSPQSVVIWFFSCPFMRFFAFA